MEGGDSLEDWRRANVELDSIHFFFFNVIGKKKGIIRQSVKS